MNKNMKNACSDFLDFFGYYPNYPNELGFDQDSYAELLNKCIADKIDYTIKKYGTDPNRRKKPFDGVYID